MCHVSIEIGVCAGLSSIISAPVLRLRKPKSESPNVLKVDTADLLEPAGRRCRRTGWSEPVQRWTRLPLSDTIASAPRSGGGDMSTRHERRRLSQGCPNPPLMPRPDDRARLKERDENVRFKQSMTHHVSL
jgi:hypothetical protein